MGRPEMRFLYRVAVEILRVSVGWRARALRYCLEHAEGRKLPDEEMLKIVGEMVRRE
ncbi:MAG: hypothetical protein ACFFGP_08475 [Promethearchaeota archaeon]